MLKSEDAQSRTNDLIAHAMRAGADAADAIYVGSQSTEIQVRLGALEDCEQSEGEEIGLRVFVGKGSASASTSDLSTEAMAAIAERVFAMAREAPDDAYAGLAPSDRLMRAIPADLAINDETEIGPQQLREIAVETEAAALAVKGVTNSSGGSASTGRAGIALATSHGFSGAYMGSSFGTSVSVLAGEDGAMQRDYAYSAARHLSDLKAPAEVGREAGERTIARLKPVKLKSGAMPVIFDPRVGPGLLGHLAGAITGAAIARKTSFLRDELGKQVFAKGITITDDPLRLKGLRSKPFDGEGLPTGITHIIEDGRLTTWLLDSASARQLGLHPTGHAQRGIGGAPGAGVTNLHMESGACSAAELMSDIKLGIYVTELIGQGVNGLTGDYSRGASGFVIRDGALAEPVEEVTIAGNLKVMFAELTPANDLVFDHAVNAPTLRVDGMTLAGD